MNLYYFGQALNLASLYMIAGLGDAIIIKSGHFNLGGEGQVYAGGFICGILLASMRSVPGVFAVTLAFIAAFGWWIYHTGLCAYGWNSAYSAAFGCDSTI